MHYLRSILSVLSAPVLYGILCVPLLGLLYAQVPQLVNEQGGTHSVPLLVGTELFQLVILVACGYCVALIAPRHLRHHVVVASVVMLVIGVSVQLSFWESVPAWHHYVFFACILGGMYLGGLLRTRQVGGQGLGDPRTGDPRTGDPRTGDPRTDDLPSG